LHRLDRPFALNLAASTQTMQFKNDCRFAGAFFPQAEQLGGGLCFPYLGAAPRAALASNATGHASNVKIS
jgi:hypothetical protein